MFSDMFTLMGRWNRLNRLRYFLYSLMFGVVMILSVFLVFMMIGLSGISLENLEDAGPMMLAVNGVVFAASAWVTACLGGKRLHDLDKSAWLCLIFLVPIVSFIFGLYLLFAPGTKGENRFGPDPLESQ